MINDFLKDLKIIDFSSRLPGPLATHYLGSLGAKVYKFENENFKDPFQTLLLEFGDETFKIWYQNLNSNKQIHTFNSQNMDDKLKQIISNGDIVIFDHPKTKEILKKQKIKLPQIEIHLKAEKGVSRPLHDLNVMADSGILSLMLKSKSEDVISPPKLPYGGILFANQIAMQMLAIYRSQSNERIIHEVYLLDALKQTVDILYPESFREKGLTDFLHNGKYPCYNIYRSKDGVYFALAAMEKKYWNLFLSDFDLKLTEEDRFKPDHITTVSEKIKEHDSKSILEEFKISEYCMNPIF